MTDVYWQGEKLPTARPGNVWLMQIYPSGRMQLAQQKPGLASVPSVAARNLVAGHMVFVWLDDAEETLRQWNERKAVI